MVGSTGEAGLVGCEGEVGGGAVAETFEGRCVGKVHDWGCPGALFIAAAI